MTKCINCENRLYDFKNGETECGIDKDNYHHLLDDFRLRPLQIKRHLLVCHQTEAKQTKKGYEREVWHSQHNIAHEG